MAAPPDESERELRAAVERLLSAGERPAVIRAIEYAKTLPAGSHVPSMRHYLGHPLRVARLLLEIHPAPSAAQAVTGVLNNVYEVSALDERAFVAAGHPAEMAAAIRLLTIDRRREMDPDYLAGYYGAIAAHSDDLTLVRCVDKLDNVLGLEVIADESIRRPYLDLTDRFVVPLARKLSPAFGDFFRDAVAHARAVGCVPESRARYERFMASG
jgi:(p)ppGpp synthase/HD superfamily hydrolase